MSNPSFYAEEFEDIENGKIEPQVQETSKAYVYDDTAFEGRS